MPNMNGLTVYPANGTARIVLPRELWREIEGGCSCPHCSDNSNESKEPAYWDTMNVSTNGGIRHTWMSHNPQLHGAKMKRGE